MEDEARWKEYGQRAKSFFNQQAERLEMDSNYHGGVLRGTGFSGAMAGGGRKNSSMAEPAPERALASPGEIVTQLDYLIHNIDLCSHLFSIINNRLTPVLGSATTDPMPPEEDTKTQFGGTISTQSRRLISLAKDMQLVLDALELPR